MADGAYKEYSDEELEEQEEKLKNTRETQGELFSHERDKEMKENHSEEKTTKESGEKNDSVKLPEFKIR